MSVSSPPLSPRLLVTPPRVSTDKHPPRLLPQALLRSQARVDAGRPEGANTHSEREQRNGAQRIGPNFSLPRDHQKRPASPRSSALLSLYLTSADTLCCPVMSLLRALSSDTAGLLQRSAVAVVPSLVSAVLRSTVVDLCCALSDTAHTATTRSDGQQEGEGGRTASKRRQCASKAARQQEEQADRVRRDGRIGQCGTSAVCQWDRLCSGRGPHLRDSATVVDRRAASLHADH